MIQSVETPHVYIVDDDPQMLRILRATLRAKGWKTHEFPNSRDFLTACRRELATPCCALLDWKLPGMDGLAIQEWLVEHEVEIPVIILSGAKEIDIPILAFRGGAVDFVKKPVDWYELQVSLAKAIAIHVEQLARRDRRSHVQALREKLSTRELQVMYKTLKGVPVKEIAQDLGIGVQTISKHKKHMLQKMQVNNEVELARLADFLEEGIDQSESKTQPPLKG